MDEGVRAQLVGGADDQIAAGHEVVVAHQVGGGADLGQVLMGLTGDAEDVGTALLDQAEGLGSAGDGLVDDDGLHQGIVGQVHDGLDSGFQLLGEVVGIDAQGDLVLAVFGLEGLSAAAVVLGLRNRAGDNADVVVADAVLKGSFGAAAVLLGLTGVRGAALCLSGGAVVAAAAGEGQDHRKRQQHAEKLLHYKPPKFLCLPAHAKARHGL